MKRLKTIIMPLLVLGLLVGIAGNGQVGSAKTVNKTYSFSGGGSKTYTLENPSNTTKLTVVYSATVAESGKMLRVNVYQTGIQHDLLSTATFVKGNEHSVTFKLPAGKTCEIELTSELGNSISGTFTYTY